MLEIVVPPNHYWYSYINSMIGHSLTSHLLILKLGFMSNVEVRSVESFYSRGKYCTVEYIAIYQKCG